jgi:hypothetical protein
MPGWLDNEAPRPQRLLSLFICPIWAEGAGLLWLRAGLRRHAWVPQRATFHYQLRDLVSVTDPSATAGNDD